MSNCLEYSVSINLFHHSICQLIFSFFPFTFTCRHMYLLIYEHFIHYLQISIYYPSTEPNNLLKMFELQAAKILFPSQTQNISIFPCIDNYNSSRCMCSGFTEGAYQHCCSQVHIPPPGRVGEGRPCMGRIAVARRPNSRPYKQKVAFKKYQRIRNVINI